MSSPPVEVWNVALQTFTNGTRNEDCSWTQKNWIHLVWWSGEAGEFTGDGHYNSSRASGNWACWLCRDLSILLDISLSMHQHIDRVTSTCFFHLRRLHKLSHILNVETRKRLVCALVLTRVDYCNSALTGLSDSTQAPLQRVLHAAVRYVLHLRPRDHVTATLQLLHWLLVRQCITYKLCVLMHGVAFGYAPTYLHDTVVPLSTLLGRQHLHTCQPCETKNREIWWIKIGRNSKHYRDIQRHMENNLFYHIGSTISLNDKIDKKLIIHLYKRIICQLT